MAVRESEDRQLGSQSEKLVTLAEAARRLDLSPADVEGMIRAGKLSAFRLGGDILRFRSSDVDALRKTAERPRSNPVPTKRGAVDRFTDFLYFNDFYIVGILIILTLLAVVFAL